MKGTTCYRCSNARNLIPILEDPFGELTGFETVIKGESLTAFDAPETVPSVIFGETDISNLAVIGSPLALSTAVIVKPTEESANPLAEVVLRTKEHVKTVAT
jgi:hypothetical protein